MANPPRKNPKPRGAAPRPKASAGQAKLGPKAPRWNDGIPDPWADPKPAPRTGTKPAPRTGTKPTPRTGAKPAPRTGAKPAPRTGTKPAPRTGAKAAPRTGAKAAPRAGAKPASRTGEKPTPRTVAKPAPRKALQGERLQKILANAGVDSRRACEEIILAGRVQVNGITVTELGTRADPRRDEVTVDFQPLTREAPVYLLLNKPKGYVTSVKDDRGRPTVMALINGVEARVYPVGRLDFNSEGLLLMTNDGDLAQRLMAPEFHVAKVYLIKVHRMPKPETLNEFREGFRLDGQRLKPCGIEIFEKADNPWLKVTLIEGKNQQLRRMFAAVGHPISKLRRIAFGPLDDPALKPGEWRFLNAQELAALKTL